jgi:hypothetical protein
MSPYRRDRILFLSESMFVRNDFLRKHEINTGSQGIKALQEFWNMHNDPNISIEGKPILQVTLTWEF